MTDSIYWLLDPAAETHRLEPRFRPHHQPVLREVRTAANGRYDYYAQIARAAAHTAFDGLFIAHRPEADDSQIIAGAIAREAPRLRLIAEFPASVGSAVYAAKQAVSFQRLAHGRLGWAIAPDGDGQARARGSDHVAQDALAARVDEFVQVARGVHGQRPFSFKGDHFEVQGGGFEEPLNRVSFPPIFLQGEGEDEIAQSARLADVHLFRTAELAVLRSRIETLDALALRESRSVAFGLALTLVAREDGDEAARDARRADAGGDAIVGDYDDVARRLAALSELGVSHFVLGGSPSLEEAYRVGQYVLPRFRALVRSARKAA